MTVAGITVNSLYCSDNRSLCTAVKQKCEQHMNAHGYSWPDMLKCDRFPLDNDLCIGLQNDMKPGQHFFNFILFYSAGQKFRTFNAMNFL